MTDQPSDNIAKTGPSGMPAAAPVARESHAAPGDRRASGTDGVGGASPGVEAPVHRPAVSASASQAAELARLSLGVAGFVLTVVMVWLMFGSASSPWVNQPAGTLTASAASKSRGTPGLAQAGVAACGTPVTLAAGPSDGKLPLRTDVTGLMEADIESFVVIGKEAVAAGRPRDAESAFLMSCRVAQQLKGVESLQSARAQYQLGWLYAQLAIAGGAGIDGAREEMIGRAAHLYAESLRLFVAQPDQTTGKRPPLVVEAPMPFPQASANTRTSGVVTPPAPAEASAPPVLEPALASTGAPPLEASLEASLAPPAPDSAPQPEGAMPPAAHSQHYAKAALAVPQPASRPPVDLRGKSRTAVAKRTDRRSRTEGKVISTSAAANVAELYRGR